MIVILYVLSLVLMFATLFGPDPIFVAAMALSMTGLVMAFGLALVFVGIRLAYGSRRGTWNRK